ncbi:DNA-methyltransferase [Candidatus Harpocratesius sp.]
MHPLPTFHRVFFQSSSELTLIPDDTIHLVITSPPYPMIEMWDGLFTQENWKIGEALEKSDGNKAFILMHEELQRTWNEISRVVCNGGIVCINIGDATRKIGKKFQMFPSHAEIIKRFRNLGFQSLPEIIWRKETNSPTKFMGSGMLPTNAYVTLEHEYILIFRKKGKREFKTNEDIDRRRKSAYFWEERNTWFSDVWKFKGVSQFLKNKDINGVNKNISRFRSGAFPFDLPWRLINMYSIQGDYILDPFLGTGTTMFAAICAGRNSIGYELDKSLKVLINERIQELPEFTRNLVENRLQNHQTFIKNRIKIGKKPKYFNNNINLPVITSQERNLLFLILSKIEKMGENEFKCEYNFFKKTDKINENFAFL